MEDGRNAVAEKTELKAETSLCTLLFVVFVRQWITIDRRTIWCVCAYAMEKEEDIL